MIETTREGKSAVATPDGKKPKEEEEDARPMVTNITPYTRLILCELMQYILLHVFKLFDIHSGPNNQHHYLVATMYFTPMFDPVIVPILLSRFM